MINKISEVVKQFFEDKQLKYEIKNDDDDNKTFAIDFKLDERHSISALIVVYPTNVCISCVFPHMTKAKVREDISEFFMRINERLKLGCFIIGYDTGIVFYNTGDRVYNIYTQEMFATMLVSALEMCQSILEPIEKVLSGDWSPTEGYNAFIVEGTRVGDDGETDQKE